MTSHTTRAFRRLFHQLPPETQRSAKKAYRLWRKNPHHKSIHFKQVHATRPIYSIRVGLSYRAIGVKSEDTVVWFWIGSHADYDTLLSRLRQGQL